MGVRPASLRAAAAAAAGHVPLRSAIRALADRARIPLDVSWTRAEPHSEAAPYGLTDRELLVLRLLAAGRSNAASSPTLLVGKGAKIAGYPANFHVRDFLDCVKTRGKTRANADVACYSHIACNAANISLFLGRKVIYDPKKNEFPGDDEANRLRSEAQREPWRI